jgi:hypothetical protein
MGILLTNKELEAIELAWETGTPTSCKERVIGDAGARHAIEEIDKLISVGDDCYALTSRQWELIKREAGLDV